MNSNDSKIIDISQWHKQPNNEKIIKKFGNNTFERYHCGRHREDTSTTHKISYPNGRTETSTTTANVNVGI